MQIKIDASEAVEELSKLPGVAQAAVLQNAQFIGEIIAEGQRGRASNTQSAHRGQHGRLTRTGHLAARIHYAGTETDGDTINIINESGAYYAIFQEFGTGYKGDPYDYTGNASIHTTKKSWGYYKDDEWHIGHPIPPKHFMYLGAEDVADAVADMLADFIAGEFE